MSGKTAKLIRRAAAGVAREQTRSQPPGIGRFRAYKLLCAGTVTGMKKAWRESTPRERGASRDALRELAAR